MKKPDTILIGVRPLLCLSLPSGCIFLAGLILFVHEIVSASVAQTPTVLLAVSCILLFAGLLGVLTGLILFALAELRKEKHNAVTG
ncbi:MAG: hypothetical protein Q4Q04_02795 [Methanocorpusculum sp.]|nr:hypothetical protein [Methanocorpusculum sp.]